MAESAPKEKPPAPTKPHAGAAFIAIWLDENKQLRWSTENLLNEQAIVWLGLVVSDLAKTLMRKIN